MKLRYLAALHHHGAHAGYAIERRLQIVGGNLPQLALSGTVSEVRL